MNHQGQMKFCFKSFTMNFANLAIVFSVLSVSTAVCADELRTVPSVDPAKYLGRWYQQARNPLVFEPLDCQCAQQTLGLNSNGTVSVFNSCNKNSVDGQLTGIVGFATIDNPGENSKLSVDFGLPRLGQYWIIGLDPEYRWAIVSDPSKSSLYILSKTPELDPELYQEALKSARTQVTTDKLRPTIQKDCRYPQLSY